MGKIMTLLLVALLAFSIIVTFSACNDDTDITKKDNVESSEGSSNTPENKDDSTPTSSETTSETTAETTAETTSETTAGGTQKPNLSPEQEDKEGSNFNPMRPL